MDKIEVGLTKFIEFTTKQGIAKLSVVRDVKYKDDYNPATDFWKKLRDGVVEMHREGLSFEHLDHIVSTVIDKKKHQYREAVNEYKKLLKRKEVSYFAPGKAFWTYENLIVRANPELGLYINGEPHLMKLYLRDDDARFDRWTSASALVLMSNSTYSNPSGDVRYSVFNVKKGKMYSKTKEEVNSDNEIMLQGEAAHFINLYNQA